MAENPIRRTTGKGGIARGCGAVAENKRKETKFS